MRTARRAVAAAVLGALAVGCAAPAVRNVADPDPAPAPVAADAAPRVDAIRPIVPTPVPALPVTVASADGRSVEVASVERIVPLDGGLAEIVWSLGLGGNVVGRDVSATFAEAADVPIVTRGHELAVEGLLSLQPTVVLGGTRTGPPEALDQVRAAGIPVVIVDEAWTIADISPRISAVAAALGVPDAGRLLADRTAAEIAAAKPPATTTPPLRVAFLYLRGTAGVYLLGGSGSGADAMIEAVGGIDVGKEAGLRPFTPLTSEALVAAAPDVLLVMEGGLESVGGRDGLLALAGVAQTPAGRDGRIAAVEDGLLLGFGPRTPAALHVLKDALADSATP